jgi:hypothetical protein
MGAEINNFIATPYDSGVVLEWTAGYGASINSGSIDCKVTIQYSTDTIPNNVQNTPPFVVRDLGQKQGTKNILWVPNLTNDQQYWYSLWVYYYDTGMWHGPFTTFATPVSGSFLSWRTGTLSFTKLGTNTRLSPLQQIVSNIIIWLPNSESSRENVIEQALKNIAPAHVKLNIFYEHYYVACTTTEQFSGSTYDPSVWTIEQGKMVNKLPTIDSSYSGHADIKS